MDCLYPACEPFQSDTLAVSDLHTIYYEQCGNPDGLPILVIHGGPGGGLDPLYRQFFNPAIYRIVLVDQRGCGQSTPHAELQENNTQNLIEDFEKIRQKLNIECWILFGGSWGSTLALAYAQAHPGVVKALILRGIFLASERENQWLFGGQGANYLFPDRWEKFIEMIPEDERDDLLSAYYQRLTDPNPDIQTKAAVAFSGWEISVSKLHFNPEELEAFKASPTAISMARLECHYMMNQCFLQPNQLLDNVDKIKHIPCTIVHGRYDVVCAPRSAWLLHKALPLSTLHYVNEAGHSMLDPKLAAKLVDITDLYAKQHAPAQS